MKLICKKDFMIPLQIEDIKPNYKRINNEILFENGKEYLVNSVSYGNIMIVNEEQSQFYRFSLEPNSKKITPYFKDTYYGDYFELIDPEQILDV